MKPGDLVEYKDELGIYLGKKTFDGDYTCSKKAIWGIRCVVSDWYYLLTISSPGSNGKATTEPLCRCQKLWRWLVKPGNLVRQAPNVFIDITVADKAMLVLEVISSGPSAGTTVLTLFEGKERVWHYEELEVLNEAL